ncbi:MAG: uroporphyrinogen-III synthase [Clostridium fessum]
MIGEVCALADTCAWREEKPLAGKRIVITRPKERSQKLAEHLRDAGAEVLEFPTIELKPVWKKSEKADAGTADKEKLYELVRNLESYHWLVLTSPAGAQYFFELLNRMQKISGAFPICVLL